MTASRLFPAPVDPGPLPIRILPPLNPLMNSTRFIIFLLLLAFVLPVILFFFKPAMTPAGPRPAIFTSATFEAAQAESKESGRLLVVDAMASWCPPCKAMDQTTWNDPAVVEFFSRHAIAFQFDVDHDRQLAGRLDVSAMPTLIVFQGETLIDRKTGYMDPDQLVDWLRDLDAARTGPAGPKSAPPIETADSPSDG